MTTGSLLSVEALSIGHGDRVVKEGITFGQGAGELTALIGANGIGKSTLLKTVAGLLPALKGQVRVGEHALGAMSATQRARQVSIVLTGRPRTGSLDVETLVSLGRQPTADAAKVRRNATDDSAGVLVAAWSRRVVDGKGQWLRWQSPPLTSRGQLQEAWQQAARWAQNPGDAEREREVTVVPLDEWQIFYFRGDAWSNPLSSDASAGAIPATTITTRSAATAAAWSRSRTARSSGRSAS